MESLSERCGRYAADDVVDPLSGEITVKRNEMISSRRPMPSRRRSDQVRFRRLPTCESRRGLLNLLWSRLGAYFVNSAKRSVSSRRSRSVSRARSLRCGPSSVFARGAEQSSVESSSMEKDIEVTWSWIVGRPVIMGRTRSWSYSMNKSASCPSPYTLWCAALHRRGFRGQERRQPREWDPYTIPIIEKYGIATLSLLDGVSVREVMDDATDCPRRS